MFPHDLRTCCLSSLNYEETLHSKKFQEIIWILIRDPGISGSNPRFCIQFSFKPLFSVLITRCINVDVWIWRAGDNFWKNDMDHVLVANWQPVGNLCHCQSNPELCTNPWKSLEHHTWWWFPTAYLSSWGKGHIDKQTELLKVRLGQHSVSNWCVLVYFCYKNQSFELKILVRWS